MSLTIIGPAAKALKAFVQTVVAPIRAAVAPPAKKKKPMRPADRPVRIDEQGRRVVTWEDDDLDELEHPERAAEWIPRQKTKDWLR